MKLVSSFLLSCSLAAVFALGADIYVSKDKGSNKNLGTKDSPVKNIQKAIDIAQEGDIVHIATGRYFGTMDRGYLELKKSITLLGGYSEDFLKRDVVKYPVLIQPTNAANATSSSKPLLDIQTENLQGSNIIIDGLIFDKGESNSYHEKDGKPEGVETGVLMIPPGKGMSSYQTASTPLIKGRANSDITIQNCFFLNSPNYAILLGNRRGNIVIRNNVFVANAYAAVEIFGTANKPHQTKLDISYNTILFNWSRTRDLGDLGHAIRAMTNMDYDINHNILGLSIASAVSNTRVDPNKEIDINDNIFFLNKKMDMDLPSGGGLFMYVKAADFEDIEALKSATGNREISDLQGLKEALNKPYLEGFLSATYKETAAYDPNSPTNLFREAMGMNKRGSLTSKVSMYANKYPLEDAFKLVGALEGYGAQSMSDEESAPDSQTSSAEQPKQIEISPVDTNESMPAQNSEAKISESVNKPAQEVREEATQADIAEAAKPVQNESNETLNLPPHPTFEPANKETNLTGQ